MVSFILDTLKCVKFHAPRHSREILVNDQVTDETRYI